MPEARRRSASTAGLVPSDSTTGATAGQFQQRQPLAQGDAAGGQAQHRLHAAHQGVAAVETPFRQVERQRGVTVPQDGLGEWPVGVQLGGQNQDLARRQPGQAAEYYREREDEPEKTDVERCVPGGAFATCRLGTLGRTLAQKGQPHDQTETG